MSVSPSEYGRDSLFLRLRKLDRELLGRRRRECLLGPFSADFLFAARVQSSLALEVFDKVNGSQPG